MKKRFKPLYDKSFFLIWIPLGVIMLGATILSALEPASLFVIIPTDIFTFYFLFSSISGYVELREDAVFIKFGFILKREIPYDRIMAVSKDRKFYSESMLSLKNAMEHINIKYNKFDVISVSVVTNDELIEELNRKISHSKV